MSTGEVVLLAAVAAAFAFGGWRVLVDGRFRGTHRVRGVLEHIGPGKATDMGTVAPVAPSVLAGTKWADSAGDRATLLQFSSAFCAPCRATRVVLADVAGSQRGVAHIEVDAEHHLDLVRRLGIFRTPTTLVLGPGGQEETRATGTPTRDQVLAALSALPE